MRKPTRLNFRRSNRIEFPLAGGICDLTKCESVNLVPQRIEDASPQAKSVETALLELCREIAGALLRGIQERQDPAQLRDTLCEDLQRTGGFVDEQAESLVALAIELIRAKSAGAYRRDESEISALVEKALGGQGSEGWN